MCVCMCDNDIHVNPFIMYNSNCLYMIVRFIYFIISFFFASALFFKYKFRQNVSLSAQSQLRYTSAKQCVVWLVLFYVYHTSSSTNKIVLYKYLFGEPRFFPTYRLLFFLLSPVHVCTLYLYCMYIIYCLSTRNRTIPIRIYITHGA